MKCNYRTKPISTPYTFSQSVKIEVHLDNGIEEILNTSKAFLVENCELRELKGFQCLTSKSGYLS